MMRLLFRCSSYEMRHIHQLYMCTCIRHYCLTHKSLYVNVKCTDNHCSTGISEIIDVRTPNEYLADHIPGAVNLPVLSCSEHQEVGTLHLKDKFAARKLGAGLIAKNISEHLKGHFLTIDNDYKPLIYCKRGGQRSLSMVLILQQIGINALQYSGGFKCYREHVRKKLLELPALFEFRVIAGKTGSGKTHLLQCLKEKGNQILDLEGLAKHKGSILGLWDGCTQPTQGHFESLLVHSLMSFDPSQPVWVESESVKIGKIHIPPVLFHHLCNSPQRYVINLPLSERIKCIKRDYPHWLRQENKDLLISILKHLVKIQGHEKVNSWISMIKREQWDKLVKDLLEVHYDPTYSHSQKKNNKSGIEKNVFMDDQSCGSISSTINYLVLDK